MKKILVGMSGGVDSSAAANSHYFRSLKNVKLIIPLLKNYFNYFSQIYQTSYFKY